MAFPTRLAPGTSEAASGGQVTGQRTGAGDPPGSPCPQSSERREPGPEPSPPPGTRPPHKGGAMCQGHGQVAWSQACGGAVMSGEGSGQAAGQERLPLRLLGRSSFPVPRLAGPCLTSPPPSHSPGHPAHFPRPLRTMLSQGRVLWPRPGPPPHWVEGWRTIPVCSSKGWTPDQNWGQTRDSRGLIICQSRHQMGKQSTNLLGDMAIRGLPPPSGH